MADIYTLKLNREKYTDKVHACWLGKNIGGTMGAPYECQRTTHDIKGFATKPGEVLPNDDLDLQLAWLHAVERLGPKGITPTTLGEIWMSYVVPNWNEYGIGKANMRLGIVPPLSGDYQNSWKHSNGAWIRTEIWASLAPGAPDIAAKYAAYDAQVDHGTGEGTYAAVFVAAMQSAAFVVNDIHRCIDIGLKAIPDDCRMADSIRFVREHYKKGTAYMDTRNLIQERNSDIGDGWFEAPSNVAYAIIGLLWGEGDFKKSMIYAINCGDDTDCTAATVGATLGILHGTAGVPADWCEYIGDSIVTAALAKGVDIAWTPTCTELTKKVVAQAPIMLASNNVDVTFVDGDTEVPENIIDLLLDKAVLGKTYSKIKANTARFDSPCISAEVTYHDLPEITPMSEQRVTIEFFNNHLPYGDMIYDLSFRWWLPEGFSVEGKKKARLLNRTAHGNKLVLDFVISAGEKVDGENRCVLEVTALGRATALYIPVIFLA